MQTPPLSSTRSVQAGFTLAAVLLMMIVLAIVGGATFMRVRGDVGYSGRDMRQTKAKAVAESAVAWALEALANPKKGGIMSYAVGTHGPLGTDVLPDRVAGMPNPGKLLPGEVVAAYAGEPVVDRDGWIESGTSTISRTLTHSRSEKMAFKIWYPNDTTVRIQGRGKVEGMEAILDLQGEIN